MPISINFFAPAYQNVLVPLANSLILPYINLVTDSIIPMCSSIARNGQSYEERVEKFNSMIKTGQLVVQIAVFFLFYQKAWNIGTSYFGLALGPVAGGVLCTVIYGVGCTLDQHLNNNITNICTLNWLHYKGSISLIESLGTNREGALAALLISGFLGLKHQHIDRKNHAYNVKPFRAAEWMAQLFFDKPQPLPERRVDGLGREAIDGVQDLPNGELK